MQRSLINISFSSLILVLLTTGAAYPKPKLDIEILNQGTGKEAVRHSKITVHYTGWLADGTKFDSSIDRGKPFTFTLGSREVILGWDMGVKGMKVGGKRVLTIPPALAYGKAGAGNTIPPESTLKFQITLLDVAPPLYTNIDNSELQRLLKKGIKVFDIRRKNEWEATGVIDKSIKLTAFNKKGTLMPNFLKDLNTKTEPEEEIVLICRTGNRTSVIANYLSRNMGYSKVYNVRKGIKMWLDEKLPVIK